MTGFWFSPALLFLQCLFVLTTSTNVYVATWGSDNNLGTPQAPFQTLPKAYSQLDGTSNTVYLYNGVFHATNNSLMLSALNVSFVAVQPPTKQKRVVLSCAEAPWVVFFQLDQLYDYHAGNVEVSFDSINFRDCNMAFNVAAGTNHTGADSLSFTVQQSTFYNSPAYFQFSGTVNGSVSWDGCDVSGVAASNATALSVQGQNNLDGQQGPSQGFTTMSVTKSHFHDASTNAAVYCSYSQSATISDSYFRNVTGNSVVAFGSVQRVLFQSNTMINCGGGDILSVSGCYKCKGWRHARVQDSIFSNNGGGSILDVSGIKTWVARCQFTGNNATMVIDFNTKYAEMTDTVVKNSNCVQETVLCEGWKGSCFFTGCQFIDNQAYGGAGVQVYQKAYLNCTDCTFIGNQAVQGGALCVMRASADLYNGILENNVATRGGAAYCEWSSFSTTGTTFVNNTSVNFPKKPVLNC